MTWANVAHARAIQEGSARSRLRSSSTRRWLAVSSSPPTRRPRPWACPWPCPWACPWPLQHPDPPRQRPYPRPRGPWPEAAVLLDRRVTPEQGGNSPASSSQRQSPGIEQGHALASEPVDALVRPGGRLALVGMAPAPLARAHPAGRALRALLLRGQSPRRGSPPVSAVPVSAPVTSHPGGRRKSWGCGYFSSSRHGGVW